MSKKTKAIVEARYPNTWNLVEQACPKNKKGYIAYVNASIFLLKDFVSFIEWQNSKSETLSFEAIASVLGISTDECVNSYRSAMKKLRILLHNKENWEC